jgi:hypothetical protein
MERRVSLLATREEIVLSTAYVYPPIPTRAFDWSAIDANTYDADYDYERGRYTSSSPQGTGATEQEAIDSLFDGLEEDEGCDIHTQAQEWEQQHGGDDERS